MGFWADGWSRVKLIGLTPLSTQSGFTAVITGANIPASVFADSIDGGGDLRICTDAAGNNQLAIEVVSWVKGSSTAELHVRFDTYSSSARELYLFYGKAGQIQPLVTDTFGRNAVWQDEELVVHLANVNPASIVDSTGNHTLTLFGGMTSGNDGGMLFDGEDDYISAPDSPGFDMLNTLSLRTIISSSTATGRTIVGRPWISHSNPWLAYALHTASDGVQGRIETTAVENSNVVINDGNPHYLSLNYDSSQMSVGVDNAAAVTIAKTSALANIDSPFYIGRNRSSNEFFAGRIKTVMLRGQSLSEDYRSLEQSNQLSPASFWTTGAPEAPGGSDVKAYVIMNHLRNQGIS